MHNEQREQFEEWLRTVCFQQPTPEAYDLAWQAWKAAQQSVQADDGWCSCEPKPDEYVSDAVYCSGCNRHRR